MSDKKPIIAFGESYSEPLEKSLGGGIWRSQGKHIKEYKLYKGINRNKKRNIFRRKNIMYKNGT